MVVFTCGHCGESVQKPKVEKHYMTKCRNRHPNLSCMDCFKDFLGNDFESHIKCVTEEERYSGKGFMAKEKKGEKKQNAWVEMVQSVLDEQKSAPKNVIRIIETISKHNNTPRKKPKFYNFVKNVCGSKTGAKDIEQAWDMISVKLAALSTSNQQNNNRDNAVNTKSEDRSDEESETGEDNRQIIQKNEKENEETPSVENDTTEQKEKLKNGEVDTEIKLSKKQRKEEKKRRKYEAELQSAEAPPPPPADDEEEEEHSKKGKKKKNKSECNADIEENPETQNSNKNKKRKRQDTANSVPEIIENGQEDVENIPVIVSKEKTIKKKLKVGQEQEADESICLHDQNVAKIEGLSMKPEKFNWHATIMSVLVKKGNEVPFKRLQKKVLMEYSEATGQDVDDRIAEKFIKKLKSAPNVRVDKNKVILLE